MEKQNKKVKESNGILGTLYRSICCEQVNKDFIAQDYKSSVLLDY
jgi:hypothetical protein